MRVPLLKGLVGARRTNAGERGIPFGFQTIIVRRMEKASCLSAGNSHKLPPTLPRFAIFVSEYDYETPTRAVAFLSFNLRCRPSGITESTNHTGSPEARS